jgi:hypothetical protein
MLGWNLVFIIFPQKLKNRGRKRKRQHQQFIGDRQFVSFVQFFLHKCGDVTLGQLHIYDNEPIVSANGEYRNPLPLADVPIPENVKNFESIYIWFVFTIKFV